MINPSLICLPPIFSRFFNIPSNFFSLVSSAMKMNGRNLRFLIREKNAIRLIGGTLNQNLFSRNGEKELQEIKKQFSGINFCAITVTTGKAVYGA